MTRVILASASPRRKELLNMLGIEFEVNVSDVEETVDPKLSPAELVQQLALSKAQDIAARRAEGLVIGADTVVVFHGQVLGKPADRSEAFAMLTRLRGQAHTVFTGIALVDAATGKTRTGFEAAEVWFRQVTDREIERYIATGEPMDKAGSYGIQGRGALLVERIHGDYFTVVGLPLGKLFELGKDFGLNLL